MKNMGMHAVCGLLHDAVSKTDSVASKDKLIVKLWDRKIAEGCARGLIRQVGLRKTRRSNMSKNNGYSVEIWTQELPSMKQVSQSLSVWTLKLEDDFVSKKNLRN
jgi:hypothetical protein